MHTHTHAHTHAHNHIHNHTHNHTTHNIYEHLKEELGESEEPLPVRTPAEVTGAALDGSCRVCLEVRGGRVCVCVWVCVRARVCVAG